MSQDVHSGAGQESSEYGLEMARRRYQGGSVRLRGKVWYGRWREDVRSLDGAVTRIQKEEPLGTLKDFPTKKLAKRELESRTTEVNSLAYRPRTLATFEQFCDKWETAVMVNHKRSAQASEKSINKVHLRPKWGKCQLKDLEANPESVQAWVSSLDVQPKTQRNIVKHLRRMMEVAIEWGYMKYNPLERVRLKPLNKFNEEFALSKEQMRLIVASATGQYKTMYWILTETGIRAGEVLALGWEHIDLERGVIRVRRKLWKGNFETVKSEKGKRNVEISDALVSHLKTLTPKEGLLFSDSGKPITYDHAVYEEFQPLLEKLGLPKCGFHAFRHGNATVMDEENVPAKTRMDRLGHQKLDTTMNYTHSKDSRDFANKLGEFISGSVQ